MNRLTLAALMLGALAARGQSGAWTAPYTLTLADRTGDAVGRPDWSFSADGSLLVLATRAVLLPDDRNQRRDIYVHDRRSGRLTRETSGPEGAAADGDSWAPDISADGRFVVFASAATNLLATPAHSDTPAVYLRDRQRGTTTLVGRGATSPSISDDGSTIVYEGAGSCGDGARSGAAGPPCICLAKRESGAHVLVSDATVAGAMRGQSMSAVVNGSGRYVAFASAPNVEPGSAPREIKGVGDIHVKDVVSGALRRVTVAVDGGRANGRSYHPAISADGRFVVFASEATNLARQGRSTRSQIYLHDTATRTTTLVSRTASGRPGNGASLRPAVSGDGQRLAFQTLASDLGRCAACGSAAADVNLLWDVLLHDVPTALTRLAAAEIDAVSGSYGVAIDGSGRVLAYASRRPRDATDVGEDADLFVVPWPQAASRAAAR